MKLLDKTPPGHGLFWRSDWEDRAGTGQLIISFNGLVHCIVQLLLKIFHVSVDFCLTAIFKKQNWKKQSSSPSPRAPSPAHWLSPTVNGLVFPLLLVFNSTKKGFAVQGFFFCEQVVIKLRLCILWAASALAPSGQCGGSTRKGLGKVESANSTSNLIPSISLYVFTSKNMEPCLIDFAKSEETHSNLFISWKGPF